MDAKSNGYDSQDIECVGDNRQRCPDFVEIPGAQSNALVCTRCQYRHNFLEGRDPLSVALVEEQTAHLRSAVIADEALRRLKPLADIGAKQELNLNNGRRKENKKLETSKKIQARIDNFKWNQGKADSGPIVKGKRRRTIREKSKREAIIETIVSEFQFSRSYIYRLEKEKEKSGIGITFPDDAKKRSL